MNQPVVNETIMTESKVLRSLPAKYNKFASFAFWLFSQMKDAAILSSNAYDQSCDLMHLLSEDISIQIEFYERYFSEMKVSDKIMKAEIRAHKTQTKFAFKNKQKNEKKERKPKNNKKNTIHNINNSDDIISLIVMKANAVDTGSPDTNLSNILENFHTSPIQENNVSEKSENTLTEFVQDNESLGMDVQENHQTLENSEKKKPREKKSSKEKVQQNESLGENVPENETLEKKKEKKPREKKSSKEKVLQNESLGMDVQQNESLGENVPENETLENSEKKKEKKPREKKSSKEKVQQNESVGMDVQEKETLENSKENESTKIEPTEKKRKNVSKNEEKKTIKQKVQQKEKQENIPENIPENNEENDIILNSVYVDDVEYFYDSDNLLYNSDHNVIGQFDPIALSISIS